MINLIKKLYLSHQFEKYYFRYIKNSNKNDLQKAIDYSKIMQENFVKLDLNNIEEKDYFKTAKIINNNLTITGKTNDLLFLIGDIENINNNLTNISNQYKKIENLSFSFDQTFKNIFLNNTKKIMKNHLDYISAEAHIVNLVKNFNTISEQDVLEIPHNFEKMLGLFNDSENKLQNIINAKMVESQGSQVQIYFLLCKSMIKEYYKNSDFVPSFIENFLNWSFDKNFNINYDEQQFTNKMNDFGIGYLNILKNYCNKEIIDETINSVKNFKIEKIKLNKV